jgi:glycosyltransferase involved in cell wall biosynthesis
MLDEKPLISIIIPSYNQGCFIEQTIKSILWQDYIRTQVIVVDGGSTDETLSILNKYSESISFISESDNGQSQAINKGFRMAKGEIVSWLNSDDIYPDKRTLTRVADAFQRFPEVDFIYGDFLEFDKNNFVIKILKRPSYSFQRLLRIGYISQPSTFFRRRVIKKMMVREDLCYTMDLEYWLRAYRLNFKFKHIPFVFAAERVHSNAKCVRARCKMERQARLIREQYGANFSLVYHVKRFFDRIMLYCCRMIGIINLIYYKNNPRFLTLPLNLNGSILLTAGLARFKKSR